MAKQIKIFGGRWIKDVEDAVNEFIKDKDVRDIRYKFENEGPKTYHNVFIIYEVE